MKDRSRGACYVFAPEWERPEGRICVLINARLQRLTKQLLDQLEHSEIQETA